MHLVVRDLDLVASFYRDNLGLAELGRKDGVARLGAGEREIVVLHHDAAARPPARTTGLYHHAILVPSRADLAQALRHMVERGTPLHGASDHLVSEALYLADPEGNGIEIYRDRARDEWPIEDGQLKMATDPLDVQRLFDEAQSAPSWTMPSGTRMGHIHLRVSDVAAAERFYLGAIGFGLMARYGHAATFVSAGGYHHHLGFNMWESRGAPPAPRGATGLAYFEVTTPDAALVDRLQESGASLEPRDGGVLARDPSGNGLLIRRA